MTIKKIFYFSFFIITIISCNEPLEINNENILGSWKAEKFISKIADIPPEYAEAGEKEFLSSIYILNPDNSMEMRSDYFKDGAKGHWELNGDTKEISMFYEYDTIKGIEKYIVTSLSKNQLVLRQDIDEQSFVELTLIK